MYRIDKGIVIFFPFSVSSFLIAGPKTAVSSAHVFHSFNWQDSCMHAYTRMACDLFDTFATHAEFVFDITDAD